VETQTIILILIAFGFFVLVLTLVAWYAIRLRRSQKLREKFGPEYDYTMEKIGDRRTAEETLLEREKRVQKLAIQALASDKVYLYKTEWDEIQADFVDTPAESVKKADRLIPK
jgi:hypothetical protein